LTTKKSKPASLTSSLLARKGEAEPAAAPYSIPEGGRQRPAESATAKGNGNGAGGDLAHALSGLAATASGEKSTRGDTGEASLHAQSARPAEPSRQAELRSEAHGVETPAFEPEAGAEAPTAEETFVESAVAEEVSLDEAVIEASVSGGGTSEGVAPAAMGEAGTQGAMSAGPTGDDAAQPEKSDADREAARDARLLRFVYAMAALTGIVAIVLYAGGWLRDAPKPQKAHAPAATSTTTASTAVGTPAATSAPTRKAESASTAPESAMPGIPAAPPVAPPMLSEEKPGTAESGVTTGGPAKPAAETASATQSPPPAAASPAPESPGKPSAAEASKPASGLAATEQGRNVKAAGDSAATAKKAVSAGESTAAAVDTEPAVPAATAPKSATPPAAAEKPVRDVPNMRVLAPAIGRPKPAEPAPKATGSVPKVVAPTTEPQTAALPKAAKPKAAKPKAAATSGGKYLVQLASVTTEAVAKREWARLRKAFPDVFGDRDLVIEKKEIAGRGTFFRVQTGGFKSLDEARSVCAGLQAKKQACLPVKR